MEGPPGEWGHSVAREEALPGVVTELVSRTVLLGCSVLRLVAGELGMVVTPRVDDVRLGKRTPVVTEGDRELVGWEDSVEGLGAWPWHWRRGQQWGAGVVGRGEGGQGGVNGGQGEDHLTVDVAAEEEREDGEAVGDRV